MLHGGVYTKPHGQTELIRKFIRELPHSVYYDVGRGRRVSRNLEIHGIFRSQIVGRYSLQAIERCCAKHLHYYHYSVVGQFEI